MILFPLLKSQSLICFFTFLDFYYFQSNKGNKNRIFIQIKEIKIEFFVQIKEINNKLFVQIKEVKVEFYYSKKIINC